MKIISRRSDPIVQKIRNVRDGRLNEYMMCEGPRLIGEVISSGMKIESLYCVKEKMDAMKAMVLQAGMGMPDTMVLVPNVMDFVSDMDSAPGVIAVVKRPPSEPEITISPEDKSTLILIIHQVQVPQNVGALMRTAEASGVSEVWTTEKTCDPYSPKALRGSAGSALRMKIRTGLSMPNLLKLLSSKGVQVVAATQNGQTPYYNYDWKKSVALAIGSEGSGFKKEELDFFNDTICIPMRGKTESLNVGIASAICLFEASRQRSLS